MELKPQTILQVVDMLFRVSSAEVDVQTIIGEE